MSVQMSSLPQYYNVPQQPVYYSVIQSQQPVTQPQQNNNTPHEMIVYLTNKPSQWSTGLCDCCDNTSICLQGLCCPCHLFAKNVERVENGRYFRSCCCYLFCCGNCNHSASRRKLRIKYNLPEEPFNDFCVSWFCGPCGLCQESLEITEQEKKKPIKQQMI